MPSPTPVGDHGGMTFGQMLLEMVEGRHVGASRRPLGAAAATGVALVAAQATRIAVRRPRSR